MAIPFCQVCQATVFDPNVVSARQGDEWLIHFRDCPTLQTQHKQRRAGEGGAA